MTMVVKDDGDVSSTFKLAYLSFTKLNKIGLGGRGVIITVRPLTNRPLSSTGRQLVSIKNISDGNPLLPTSKM